MKIKNNTPANLSVGAVSTIGSANKKFMVVPGEATLELDDALWLAEFAKPSAKMLEAGNLVITEAPAKSDEQLAEEEAAALEAAKELLDKAEKKAKVTPKAAPKDATK